MRHVLPLTAVLLACGGALAADPSAGGESATALKALSADSQAVVAALTAGHDMMDLCRGGPEPITRKVIDVSTVLAQAGRIDPGRAMDSGGATAAYWPVYCRDLFMSGVSGR